MLPKRTPNTRTHRKQTMPKQFPVPTLDSVNPALAELTAKKIAISAEDLALQTEEFDLARTNPPPEPDVGHSLRVAEILGEVAPQQPTFHRGRLAEIASRRRDLRTAIDVLDGRVVAETRAAEAIVRDQVRAAYNATATDLCRALVTAHGCHVAYRRAADAIESAGVSLGNLGDFEPRFLGKPKDAWGPVARFLGEARQAGIIGPGDIPPELRS